MNPLLKAFGLSALNTAAYFILRIDDVFAKLFPGVQKIFFEVSGSHFILFGLFGMLMILFAAFVAGRMSILSFLSFRNMPFKRK